MIIVTGIRLPLGSSGQEAEEAARKKVGLPGEYALRRVSYDLRRGQASMVCSVTVSLSDPDTEKRVASSRDGMQYAEKQQLHPKTGTEKLESRPVVVGAGPAGL
ncbi:MAG: hypothetical protein J6W57_02985, partial [Oscillospiraceae bacterium]|nr:hypothetical protein [Oscillospiraceae bacterium]